MNSIDLKLNKKNNFFIPFKYQFKNFIETSNKKYY